MISAIDDPRIARITVEPKFTILQALKKMDELGVKLLLIADGELFHGLVSIGDIQRAIIKNVSLDEVVDSIKRSGIRYTTPDADLEDVRQEMFASRIECMPVVSDKRKLHGVYFWDEVFSTQHLSSQSQLNLAVVVMAGGKGTRLAPITNILPKPLVPIGDKTILEHIFDRFISVGCNHFLMSVNYRAEMIKQYFHTLGRSEYSIEYFQEERFLGTAGSLHLLKGRLTNTFFVTNCDIIVDTDYGGIYQYHVDHKNDITVVGVIKSYPIPYGVLETGIGGILTGITEKPELTFKINSGVYILEPHVLDSIPEDEPMHITDLIEVIRSNGGRVGVFPVSEGAWMDIGDWTEYNKTTHKMGVQSITLPSQ